MRGVAQSFGAASQPYLMATEFPWFAAWDEVFGGKEVLAVGGSGDVPFYFAQEGAARVLAVDVSLHACFLIRLKRACLQELGWRDFLSFFLSDIPAASDFLKGRGVPSHLDGASRGILLERLKHRLRKPCCKYWERQLQDAAEHLSPFAHFLRATDLCGLHLIPCMSDPGAYGRWREAASKVQVLNLSLDVALKRLEGPWDLIYASNIFEYLEMDHVLRDRLRDYEAYVSAFARRAHKSLQRMGKLCWYAYENRDSVHFRKRLERLRSLFGDRWAVSTRAIEYGLPKISQTRFRNTLIVFEKC